MSAKSLWMQFLRAGFPPDTPPNVERQLVVLNAVILGSGLFALLFGILATGRGDRIPGIMDFGLVAVAVMLHLLLRLFRSVRLTAFVAVFCGGLLFVSLVAHGSVNRSGFTWLALYPLVALLVLGARGGSLLVAIILAGVLVVFVSGSRVSWFVEYPLNLEIRIVSVYLLVYFFTLVMVVTRDVFLARLEQTHAEEARQLDELERINREKAGLIGELEKSLAEVRTLRGLLPVCQGCGKVRDDEGYWNELGTYLSRSTGTKLTHGVCPACSRELLDEVLNKT